MEKIIHQIWIGPYEIPEREKDFTDKIKKYHPDFDYILWDNNNIPELPENLKKIKDIYQKNKEWVKIADMLRYYIVYKYGGIYIDCDYELLNPIQNFKLENYDGFLTLHYTMGKIKPKKGETICNSIFGFSKEHPLTEKICDNIENNISWLGPHFFGKYVKEFLGYDEYTSDDIISESLEKINIKTMHSRGEFKEKYLLHHYSYNWHPENQKKLKIDKKYKLI